MIEIDNLIKDSMKSRDKIATNLYKEIKTAIMNYKTAKNAKPYDNASEIQILKKVQSQHNESLESARNAQRNELISEEEKYLALLEKLIPAAPTQQEIDNYIHLFMQRNSICNLNGELAIPKKIMGATIKSIKDEFPTADGKVIAQIVNSYVV